MTTKVKKLKFETQKAKSAKDIKQRSKSKNSFGNMVWVPRDGSKTMRIAAEPKDWIEYTFVMVEETDGGRKLGFRGKLPCYQGFDQDVPEAGRANPRQAFVIPVVLVEDGTPGDQIMFYEPPKKVLNDLLAHFDRRQTVTDRDFEVAREGTGRETVYTLFADDPKKRVAVARLAADYLENDEPSFIDELQRMVNEFNTLYNASDDEEVEEPVKASTKKSALQDTDPEDDDDDEEDADPDDQTVTGTFTVSDVDVDTFTVDLVSDTGRTFETVYLDKSRDDIDAVTEGGTYTLTIVMDDDGDWIASTEPVAVKAKRSSKR